MSPIIDLIKFLRFLVARSIDLSIVARAFATVPGQPRWNETADLNKDGRVNINDVAIVARDYGKKA
jgi:beta-lactamase class A